MFGFSGAQNRVLPFFLLPYGPQTLTECEERVCMVVDLGSFDRSWWVTQTFFFVI